jgi:hypothetical protein
MSSIFQDLQRSGTPLRGVDTSALRPPLWSPTAPFSTPLRSSSKRMSSFSTTLTPASSTCRRHTRSRFRASRSARSGARFWRQSHRCSRKSDITSSSATPLGQEFVNSLTA